MRCLWTLKNQKEYERRDGATNYLKGGLSRCIFSFPHFYEGASRASRFFYELDRHLGKVTSRVLRTGNGRGDRDNDGSRIEDEKCQSRLGV